MSVKPKIIVKIPAPAPAPADFKSLFPLCDLRAEGGLLHALNCNEKITTVFQHLIDVTKQLKASTTDKSEKTKQGYRITSFQNALNLIRGHPTPIASGREAAAMKGIGKGISARIDEILSSGTLVELEETMDALDPATKIVTELCQITGIGEVKARSLHEKFGVTSIDDLIMKYKSGKIKVAKNELTHHIAVGLEFFHDLQHRIPWKEVDQIRQILDELVTEINPKLKITVCGSYRRHRPDCGDIDVLLTHDDVLTELQLESGPDHLGSVVNALTEAGLIVGHLTEHGRTKFMGVCQLESDLPGRRIDIRFVAMNQKPAAMLYFTGSGSFNKIMRYKANERGYTINEYGIYTYLNGIKGDLVEVHSEEDIFKVINCVYLDPTKRDF